jgi:hypothetical protein
VLFNLPNKAFGGKEPMEFLEAKAKGTHLPFKQGALLPTMSVKKKKRVLFFKDLGLS